MRCISISRSDWSPVPLLLSPRPGQSLAYLAFNAPPCDAFPCTCTALQAAKAHEADTPDLPTRRPRCASRTNPRTDWSLLTAPAATPSRASRRLRLAILRPGRTPLCIAHRTEARAEAAAAAARAALPARASAAPRARNSRRRRACSASTRTASAWSCQSTRIASHCSACALLARPSEPRASSASARCNAMRTSSTHGATPYL